MALDIAYNPITSLNGIEFCHRLHSIYFDAEHLATIHQLWFLPALMYVAIDGIERYGEEGIQELKSRGIDVS